MSHVRSKVAIIIKALNEQENIARSIESALMSTVEPLSVILADSGSTDKTIEIALSYPIKIVQLANFSEKSCGIGAQLGFQFLSSEFVYLLDGDMQLNGDFLNEAVRFLEKNPRVAGVAGLVEEFGSNNYEFERRKSAKDGMIAGKVDFLDMGGLYRTSSINSIGYLTNRNLHSYEEKELAFRLSSAGFDLIRLPILAVKHYGKTESTADLLIKRWNSRHLDGPGEWVRSLSPSEGIRVGLSFFWKYLIVIGAGILMLMGILISPWTSALAVGGLALQVLLFLWALFNRRSFGLAGIAYVNILICAAGIDRKSVV